MALDAAEFCGHEQLVFGRIMSRILDLHAGKVLLLYGTTVSMIGTAAMGFWIAPVMECFMIVSVLRSKINM